MDLTPGQQTAIGARGNVLVKASAGTGKTRTLVERCLARILDPAAPIPIDRVLVVTFTEAAAAEVRRRLRAGLDAAAAGRPDDPWLNEPMALLDTAPIGTLHSFCLRLVRQHFYLLGLDPQLTVLDASQADLLAATALETVLHRHYAGNSPADTAVQELILAYGRAGDQAVRNLVRRVHAFTQTLPDPQGWFDRELQRARQSRPEHWESWLREGLAGWRRSGLDLLRAQPAGNELAQACLQAMEPSAGDWSRAEAARVAGQIQALDQEWPRGKRSEWRPPLASWLQETAFWHSLAPSPDGVDPLDEDWAWMRAHLVALLELAQEFGGVYAHVKREQAVLDFHDLEQFALRVLWDPARGQPTPIALQWRERLRLLFVDEYQDINAAQDRILELLSRDGPEANRFLVGDVKQSIYRFRLADPQILRRYEREWREASTPGQVVPLVENFRSHPAILEFVNRAFAALMRLEVGGVEYDAEARLVPGRRPAAATPSGATEAAPVEFHLRLKRAGGDAGNAETDEVAPGGADPVALLDEEHEARLVARRLREVHSERRQVWDRGTQQWRAVEWRDMAVLLRSPRNKAETYAKEFARWGIPLNAARRGFYDGTEVTDLLGILQVLDNPLQDVPLLAVLRSPLAGLTVNDLAAVRLAARQGHFWTALRRFHDTERGSPAWPRVDQFVGRYERWREQVRRGALSRCLETVLDETGYLDWLTTQPRGDMRGANVRRLLAMTRQFDRLQRQGLFRFLRWVESQQAAEAETEPAAFGSEDAVRLMSIHQSKGLEVPVVVVADLGKPFNFEELRQEVILDEVYGLAPVVQPPGGGPRYPSLPCWLARQRQRLETLGEELRLLYVAMTRGCDLLILTGTASRKAAEDKWRGTAVDRLSPADLVAARNTLDWLGPLMAALTGTADWLSSAPGQNPLLSWRIYAADDVFEPRDMPESADREQRQAALPLEPAQDGPAEVEAASAALQARLDWRYPHNAATLEPAKTSVSALRRRWLDEAELETQQLFTPPSFRSRTVDAGAAKVTVGKTLSATEIGTAHHVFLQFVALELPPTASALAGEAARMEHEGILPRTERQVLDLAALAGFLSSDLGQRFRAQAERLHRELPFTARFNSADLAALKLPAPAAASQEEFAVVQGVVDWAAVLDGEIWIVDFKTDQVQSADLAATVKRYEPQVKLYAAALSRIYRRPVTQAWLHFLSLNRSVSVR